jgi:Asp-tRNA(Asn)/Glu-tRNA(Gln) amidotransferase C subunit
MRLKPGLTSSEAFEMLSAAAKLSWGADAVPSLESKLREIAQAMEVIGNLDIDDDTEPLFGENEELPEASA